MIDPSKKYQTRDGREVVRLIPLPEVTEPTQQLCALVRQFSGAIEPCKYMEDGRSGTGAIAHDLIECPPQRRVVGYENVSVCGTSCLYASLARCRSVVGAGEAIGRIRVWSNGRVDNIPLDMTDDPEARA